MALFKVKETLARNGIDCTFLGSYAWRQTDNTPGGGGNVGMSRCRFDSLGLFAVKKVTGFERLLTVADIQGGREKDLHEFQYAQGYPSTSYLGGDTAIIEALNDYGVVTRGGGAASSSSNDQTEVEEALPFVKQKPIDPRVWDAPGQLRGHGAHMPLLFFVGDRPLRSEDSLTAREARMVAMGVGARVSQAQPLHDAHLAQPEGQGQEGQGQREQGQGEEMSFNHPW